jgi:hypothetical protein
VNDGLRTVNYIPGSKLALQKHDVAYMASVHMVSSEDNCALEGRNFWGPPALDQDQGSVDRSESPSFPQSSFYVANKLPEKQEQNDLVDLVDLSG